MSALLPTTRSIAWSFGFEHHINIYIYISEATHSDSVFSFAHQSKDTGASPSLPDNHQQCVGPHGYAFGLQSIYCLQLKQRRMIIFLTGAHKIIEPSKVDRNMWDDADLDSQQNVVSN